MRGLEIRRDGVAVLQAELDSALPVDPGSHTLEASAPGKQPWSTTVQIGADAPNVVVDVPELAEATSAKDCRAGRAGLIRAQAQRAASRARWLDAAHGCDRGRGGRRGGARARHCLWRICQEQLV